MMRKLILILALLFPLAAASQVVVTIKAPTYGYNVVTGSTRQLFASLTDGGLPCDNQISAYSITSNVITITAPNSFIAGATTTMSNFPTSTFLNGQTLTVLSTGLSTTQFEANFTHANASATETGTFTIGSDTCKVTWTAVGTGGATATFTNPSNTGVSTIASTVPTVQVNFGGTGCSTTGAITGTMGSYVIGCSSTVTITATSVDPGGGSASVTVKVFALPPATLANGESDARVFPDYNWLYQGQYMPVYAEVVGCPDQSGIWSITGQPAGGNGALTSTNVNNPLFHATVTGRYTLTFTANCNGATATAIDYVSPNALPSYTVTPDGSMPHESYTDPALTGTVYDVGPGQTYANLEALPAANTLTAGSVIRLHNADTGCTTPTTYHENWQFQANTGTQGEPFILVGIPNSCGELPVLDGANATMQSGLSTGACAGYGVVCVWGGGYGSGTPYGYWQSGSAGPSHIHVWNIHMKDATPNFTYTPPGGGAATAYISGASCANIRGGSYVDFEGNVFDTCSNGAFSAENSNSAWADITQEVTFIGNKHTNNGWSTDSTEHAAYFQSFFGAMTGESIVNYLSTATGSCLKWRGVDGIFEGNYCASGPLRMWDGVENQDASAYVSFEPYLGPVGDLTCTHSLYCDGDQMGANLVYYQEAMQHDYVVGNNFNGASSEYQVHDSNDHDGGMADRQGLLEFNFNTLNTAAVVFDTASGSCGGCHPYYAERVHAQNNILWFQGTRSMAFSKLSSLIYESEANLMKTGSFSLTTPINGYARYYNAGNALGWQTSPIYSYDYTQLFTLQIPMESHLYNLATGYLSTSAQPFDSTTFVPPLGSAAIGAATALTGDAALIVPNLQLNPSTGVLSVRTTTTDIGAMQSGSAPPAAPGNVTGTVFQGAIVQ